MIKNYLAYIKEQTEHLLELDPYGEDNWDNDYEEKNIVYDIINKIDFVKNIEEHSLLVDRFYNIEFDCCGSIFDDKDIHCFITDFMTHYQIFCEYNNKIKIFKKEECSMNNLSKYLIDLYKEKQNESILQDPFEDDLIDSEIEYDNLSIGDKVLCQDSSLSRRLLELKKIYIISDIKRGQYTQIKVSGINDEWWDSDRFEKI